MTDRYRAALETVAQWDEWAAQRLRELDAQPPAPAEGLAEAVSDSLAATTEGTDWAEAPEPSDEPGSPYVLRLTNELRARGVTLQPAAPAEGLPTPQELIAARSVIRRLHRAVGYGKVRDVSGMEMWDSLVEGGRGIAVTTAYLGSEVDAAYGAAWEKMMDGDDHD